MVAGNRSHRRTSALGAGAGKIEAMDVPQPEFSSIDLGDCVLSAATWGDGPVDIVMLHDGLGSISQWRSVPGDVAARTGATVLAYERAGHGSSTPVPSGPWPTKWLHHEAAVLARLLADQKIERPFIVGHSDGGSTALIHASTAGQTIRGLLTIAPHSWVEEICWSSIVGMRANRDRIVAGLSRHHQAPAEVFEAWSGVWVSDDFRSWDIRPTLGTIEVPAVIAQGSEDAYASDDQIILTAHAIGPNARWQLLPGLGHIAHHDDADAVVDLIVETYQSV